jgi:hypothetical protein
MTKRHNRSSANPEGPSSGEIIILAMECFEWTREKVLSWYERENPRLNKSRPSELVARGQGQKVIEFLESKRQERVTNQERTRVKN